jgi:hypothetical protein
MPQRCRCPNVLLPQIFFHAYSYDIVVLGVFFFAYLGYVSLVIMYVYVPYGISIMSFLLVQTLS